MIIVGNILLVLTALTCFASVAYYAMAAFRKPEYEKGAAAIYQMFVILAVVLSLFFLSQILSHNYELEYVYSYSSNSLSFPLLLSTFWAGQTGTFVLWLMMAVIVGLFLYKSKWEHRNKLMFFYLLTTVFLMVLLLVKSPFKPLDTEAMGIPAAHLPLQDGRGLNPLLQNFWMVIHPPIVFVGYTLLAVPFAYALAALSARDYSNWSTKVFPWSLISGAILGLGIFLGGYWAYETLGWGGYWAWDPVENSSLIPWLTNLALIHGLLIERKRGTLRKTNLGLAIIGFLLVLYGTFLTRSGILQEFSVHSFVAPGKVLYWVMVIFMAGFFLLGLVLFLTRLKSLKQPKQVSDQPQSQMWFETLIILGALFTILLAVLTWVGTSSPLFTTLIGNPSSVDQQFYNSVAMPIGIIMAILAAISSLYIFYTNKLNVFIRKFIIALVLAAIATVVSFILGVRQASVLALVFSAFLAIMANILAILSMQHKSVLGSAGNITHIGFGLILIGFVVSSGFAKSSGVIKLESEKVAEVLDMHCRFEGIGTNFFSPDNKVKLAVSSGGESYTARPAFYQDPYSGQTVINPYIHKSVFYDTYFAPQRYIPDYTTLTLSKGESNSAFGYEIKFNEFRIGEHASGGAMKVGAVLEVTHNGETQNVVPYFYPNPQMVQDAGYADIPDSDYKIYLDRINADQGQVVIDVVGVGDLVLEISKKPMINLVWFGGVVIVLGSVMAFVKRRKIAER